ncbi:hypothetical protein [Candidatus Nitrotoga sp. 1052]|uniref:hypothetical protein n=1 Tax=Candidatus Nitrotoga sp. 1052 TaxID=2886964 RepID=UPI001EF5E132|nr:hypothetical protein [Candidatus Nitrotoga sp. 1052]CAH1082190.1 conserved hypothetical protein [Candidatus Nitrotoga sp. 1052]
MQAKKQQKCGGEDHNLLQDAAQQGKSVDESRRRLTKSGLAVSGVLLTIASRPSLGGDICKTPSGFLSGNLSFHGTPQSCSGRTPGYWGTHYDWPSPYLVGSRTDSRHKQNSNSWSGGTMFNNSTLGFDCSGNGARYITYSMMQVILLGGSYDPYQLGAHCVAALLNARSGWTPVLTEAQVRNIFNEYASNGYFEPTAGIHWTPEEIVTYLKQTMPL